LVKEEPERWDNLEKVVPQSPFVILFKNFEAVFKSP
jgi:hypothetical protein